MYLQYLYKLPGKQYLGLVLLMNTFFGPCLIVMQCEAFIVQIQQDAEVLAVFSLSSLLWFCVNIPYR